MESAWQKFLSDVGFEPTPTFVDQKALCLYSGKLALESGALDHSANLTRYRDAEMDSVLSGNVENTEKPKNNVAVGCCVACFRSVVVITFA